MHTAMLLIHVLGACVWTGGHIVLSLVILPRALASGDPAPLAEFDDRFEKLAVPALLAQVGSGLWLAWSARPDPAGWLGFGDPLALHLTLKLLLLAATLGLAVDARLRLPRSQRSPRARLHAMAWHVVAVTVLALLLVVVGVGLHAGA